MKNHYFLIGQPRFKRTFGVKSTKNECQTIAFHFSQNNMLGVSLLLKKHLVEERKNHFYTQILETIHQNATNRSTHSITCIAQKNP